MARPIFLARFDLRNPSFAGVSGPDRFAAALDMAEWADRNGAFGIVLSEHHGSEDGYLPSALTMAAAVAARTSSAQVYVSAVPAPLHDPLQLAEQVAVVDLISDGRLQLVVANGYVPSELEMFDVDPARRAALVTEAVAVLRAARSGEPFEHRGRTVRVTPAVARDGRDGPPIILGGGTPGAARRAARIADGFQPSHPEAWEVYRQLRTDAGHPDPGPFFADAGFVFVSEDPDATWDDIEPYVRHDAECYSRWAAEAGVEATPAYRLDSDDIVADLKARGLHRVLTADQLLADLEDEPFRPVILNPMVGGTPPEVGWASLELFERDVLGA